MKITAINGRFSRPIYLPTDHFVIRDELDKLRADGDTKLHIKINVCNEVGKLVGKEFDTDLYKMNFLADRIETDDPKRNIQMAALLTVKSERTVDELIRMTYSDSVSVYPCRSYEELGEMVIDNELLPGLNHVPDSLLPLLDREQVGKRFAEQENGVFANGYYCLPTEYVELQINVEIAKPKDIFFSLILVPYGKDLDQYGQRFDLPCSKETLEQFASECGVSLDKMNYYSLRSSIPLMYDPLSVTALNDLAVCLAALENDEFVKLKAVMQTMPALNTQHTMELITHLNEYDLDRQVRNSDDYGYSYLEKFLPPEFSPRVFEDTDLTEVGDEVLLFKRGQITTYGAISGKGEQLYTPIVDKPVLDEYEDEDESEDECEDMGMGVIS